jgi:N-acetylmuramoyl-L-alanine amidase
MIETRLGVRVILTRDEDRRVGADERASTANNSKADLFLSLHFNGALEPRANGAEVYYLSLDQEGQAALKAAQSDSLTLPVLGGGTRPIDLIRWDMAQVRHIEASSAFASMLQDVLRMRVPMGERPLQQGPMRVLVGVNMPAALIEMAYLTNADQAKQAASGDFQTSVTQAIYDGILRFRDYLEGHQ